MARRKKRLSTKIKRVVQQLLVVALILGSLVLGDLLGLIDVDWQQVSKQGQQFLREQLRRFYTPLKPAVEPVSGEWYRLYFTTPRYPDRVSTRIHVIEHGLLEIIDKAQEQLDICIYDLNLQSLAEAILAAQDRGVRVRIVADSEAYDESEVLQGLKRQGIALVHDERSALMHNKFVVADRHTVWTGSWNFTENGTFRNNNNAMVIHSVKLAENYTVEFEEMFTRRAFGPTSPENTVYPNIQLGDTLIESCFAPEDECAAQIVTSLQQARQSIHFMAFSFSHDEIGQVILDRARAGIAVQGIFESNGADTEYSEYARLRREGVNVRQDGNPYILHHKVFIVDETIVVFGSFNFSNNADTSNDENLLIVHHPEIAAQFLAEFERVAAEAQ